MELFFNELPQELISKIMLYTLKSPHTDLECGILKHILGGPIYNKMMQKKNIKLDERGHVTDVDVICLFFSERKKLQFNVHYLHALPYLYQFNLCTTNVYGDIKVLNSLPNLARFRLYNTKVYGNIMDMKKMPNLTSFDTENTHVVGNSSVFYHYRKEHKLGDCRIFM